MKNLRAWAAACLLAAASSQMVAAFENIDVIRPTGDENLGALLITPPAWTPEESKKVLPVFYSYRNQNVATGTKLRFPEGKGNLEIRNSGIGQLQINDVAIEKGKVNEVKLSGMTVTVQRGPNTNYDVDFGYKPQLSILRDNQYLFWENSAIYPGWNGTTWQSFVVTPGEYVINFNHPAIEKMTEKVTSGQIKTLALNPVDQRATIKIHLPKREFANPTAKCLFPHRNFLILRAAYLKEGDQVSWEPYPVNSTIYKEMTVTDEVAQKPIRMLPYPKETPHVHYEFVSNNIPTLLKLSPGETKEIFLKRIDVDNVLITDEAGKKRYLPGSYSVERWNEKKGEEKWVRVALPVATSYSCQSGLDHLRIFPTKTGLDVPPGKYRVTVYYKPLDSKAEKTQVHEIDLTR